MQRTDVRNVRRRTATDIQSENAVRGNSSLMCNSGGRK